MHKRPINDVLALVVERKPEVQVSHQYRYIMQVLAKDNENITNTEKLMVRDNLRALCEMVGLSYARLVMGLHNRPRV